jgi:hypothetical protein
MPEPGHGVEPAERARLDREDEEERELVRPPDINRESNRSATRLKLFFDLAFVLFVARCADVLATHETVAGGLPFAAILALAGGRGPAPRCTPTGSTPTTRSSDCSP